MLLSSIVQLFHDSIWMWQWADCPFYSTASRRLARVKTDKRISAADLATAVPDPMAIPISAFLRAGASLTPSPVYKQTGKKAHSLMVNNETSQLNSTYFRSPNWTEPNRDIIEPNRTQPGPNQTKANQTGRTGTKPKQIGQNRTEQIQFGPNRAEPKCLKIIYGYFWSDISNFWQFFKAFTVAVCSIGFIMLGWIICVYMFLWPLSAVFKRSEPQNAYRIMRNVTESIYKPPEAVVWHYYPTHSLLISSAGFFT